MGLPIPSTYVPGIFFLRPETKARRSGSAAMPKACERAHQTWSAQHQGMVFGFRNRGLLRCGNSRAVNDFSIVEGWQVADRDARILPRMEDYLVEAAQVECRQRRVEGKQVRRAARRSYYAIGMTFVCCIYVNSPGFAERCGGRRNPPKAKGAWGRFAFGELKVRVAADSPRKRAMCTS